MGKTARIESARLLRQKISEIAGEERAVIMGDFNTTPADEPMLILTDSTEKPRLIDAKSVSESGHYGPTGTFNGFKNKERDDLPIDYIFIKGPWVVKKHGVISQTWEGRFASDHFAVIAVLESSDGTGR